MNLEASVLPGRMVSSLTLSLYFLNFSCGQDPAFSTTRFATGASQSQADVSRADGESMPPGSESEEGIDNPGAENNDDSNNENNGDNENEYNSPDDPEEVVEMCATLEQVTQVSKLNFPERQDCQWGVNGNGERLNVFMQARERQTRTFSLPDGAVLCELDVASTTNTIHYDDFLYLTLNDNVLVGSNGYFVEMFEKSGDIYRWDWNRIFGQQWGESMGPGRHSQLPSLIFFHLAVSINTSGAFTSLSSSIQA